MSFPFRLYVISDRARMGDDPASAVASLAQVGLRAFHWREKDLTPAETYGRVAEIAQRIDATGLLRADPCGNAEAPTDRFRLFVNDRADLALSLCLDLHLTESSLPTQAVRGILHPGQLIGRSTHGLEGARRAESEGADFVTFGPVYDTFSKRIYGPPAGLASLREVCSSLTIPVFALGGVNAARVAECRRAGAAGVAVVGAVWNADDRVQAVRELLAAAS